ncbi:MAG: 50S ribosomal protein L22 [Deltaproteobacteria bacterium]|nr:50S ribosomal protein L22 [Deltaproteobacteria bacterium]
MANQIKAKISHLRVSPRKVRLVCDLVRGKKVQEAIDLLRFTKRGCSRDLMKLIQSALSNANHKGGVDVDKLHVNTLYVDQGPTLKRSLPRARGSASPILKRTSHITVVLAEK